MSCAWLAATISAVLWRRRYPMFALAVLWYLAGHIIESTVVPLELYFEHRNYLPIVGPIIALTAFLLLHSAQSRKFALAVIPVVMLANAWFLHSFASLSSDSSMASRYWAMQHPHSVRAITNMATYQLAEGRMDSGIATIQRFAQDHPPQRPDIQQAGHQCEHDPWNNADLAAKPLESTDESSSGSSPMPKTCA